MYRLGKVRRASIQLRWSGVNSGNNVLIGVVPTLDITSISSIYVARTSPFYKEGAFSVSKPDVNVDRSGWLSHSIDPMNLFGGDRLESKADSFNTVFGFNSTGVVNFNWQVFVQTNDLDVTSTSANLFQVRVMYETEVFNLGLLPNT